MTLNEFYNRLDGKPIEDMIVHLRYKYSHEDTWTYSNQILTPEDSGEYEWFNDWYEGQQDIEVLGYVPLSDVFVPNFM